MDCDVLVIGAGPAGCAAGIAATRAGADVLVLDRAHFPRPKTCGDALSNDAVALCAQLGAIEAIEGGPHARVHGAVAHLPSGFSMQRRYRPPGLIVERVALDDALRRTLEGAGATVREGVRALKLTRAREGVTVNTTAGVLRARVVVAADGPSSVAWPLLGFRPPKRRALAVARTIYLQNVTQPEGVSEHYFETFLPGGYGWCFPAVGGNSNVGVYQLLSRYTESEHLGVLLDRFLKAHPERFAGATPAAAPRTWPLPVAHGHLPPAAPGVLCAGDAACLVDPLSGEGIWQALTSGQLAGDTAARAAASGGLTAADAWRHRALLARQISLPSASRSAISWGMTMLVHTGWEAKPWVRAALRWGYAGGVSDLSKTATFSTR